MRPHDATWTLAAVTALALGCSGKPVPGDPARFDPVAMSEAMLAEAGQGFALVQFEASGVRPDGTIDLTDERVDGEVNYRLERAVDPPADQPPLGAGGSEAAIWREEARVRVRRAGWHHTGTRRDIDNREVKSYDRTRGLEVRLYDPRPGSPAASALPTCDFATLWQAAIAAGAPPAAVAKISYDGDSYDFSIPGTEHRLAFTPDCAPR